jgi:hypothetical protein
MIAGKYHVCARDFLTGPQIDESLAILEQLERAPNISRLMDILRC